MEAMTSNVQDKTPDILIVDDTPGNLHLLAVMLKARGYRVRPVPSGKLAFQAIQQEKPDLILLDINMPEMNGYEVCEQLKATEASKDIPVLFISALDETLDKLKAFAAGGVDYVTKPFHCEEVHARVETHLKIRSLQWQLRKQNEELERLVAQRTRQLAQAYQRVLELGRLKNDFLHMISHEIRTPANGVLGIGDLLVTLCPDSETRSRYADMFQRSSLRLRNLIEDATMIADMENLSPENGVAISFPALLGAVREALPDIRTSIEQPAGLEAFSVKGSPLLLKRAMTSIVLLAAAFSRDKHAVHGMVMVEGQALRMRLQLDALSLPKEQAAVFFEVESPVRSASAAESLGLAPVVARQIIAAFGGELRLVKENEQHGYLEAMLVRSQD